jgi:hypothetical protein
MIKRKCPLCSEVFNNKRDLIDHLRDEYEEGATQADMAAHELEMLGADIYD